MTAAAPSPSPVTDDGFALDLLGRLVALAAGPDDVAAIQAVDDLLAVHYEHLGFRTERVPVAGRGDLLVATMATGRPGPPERRRVTIVGHSDTVWPVGSVADPCLRVDESRGRWAGPGIGDMKAALLMAADAALGASVRLRDAPAGVVRIVVVPDEEVGSVASAEEIARLVTETDLCIGLEAGKPNGAFVTSRGAVGALRVGVHGAAAHVTEPGGVNALDGLLDVLDGVRAIDLAGVQLSITRVDGGTARQITAADASAWIDVRCDSPVGMRLAVAAVEDAAADARRRGASVQVTGGQTRPAFPRAAADAPLALLRGPAAPGGVHERGGSDASTFAAAGVPTIDGFGPVCFDNCAPDESIAVDSVGARTALMSDLIVGWSTAGGAR